MNAKNIIIGILLLGVCGLGSFIVYQKIEMNKERVANLQGHIKVNLELYKVMQSGNSDLLNQSIASLVTGQAAYYELQYGKPSDPVFAEKLKEALGIAQGYPLLKERLARFKLP